MSQSNDKNKIICFSNDDLYLITNGDIRNITNISDVNKIGNIIDPDKNQISEITPLIMILNSARKNWKRLFDKLVSIGADPDMKIQYYGKKLSANDIKNTYRN